MIKSKRKSVEINVLHMLQNSLLLTYSLQQEAQNLEDRSPIRLVLFLAVFNTAPAQQCLSQNDPKSMKHDAHLRVPLPNRTWISPWADRSLVQVGVGRWLYLLPSSQ
jgi:hypothetical protein